MIDGAAVKEMADRFARPLTLENLVAFPKDWSVADPASLVKPGPQAETLGVYTLGALRDYLKHNRDSHDLATLAVHVVSPQLVRVCAKLDARARSRETFLQASALNLTDKFLDTFMEVETFIIGLQSRFALTDDRQNVLRLLSNIKQEAVKTSQDDGISQTVTSKAGVALVAEVQVPNPVELSPFRTFREVLQPASPFALRVQGRGTGMPQVGLFEADGGAWRLVAVDRVRDWLVSELPEGVAVLA